MGEAKLLCNLGYQSALVSIPPRINHMFRILSGKGKLLTVLLIARITRLFILCVEGS